MKSKEQIERSGSELLEELVKQPRDVSKRSSFKLSRTTYKAMSWLLNKQNFSPKKVFDIISNEIIADSLLSGSGLYYPTDPSIFEKPIEDDFVRKSYVISNEALKKLNKYAKDKDIKRDILVNFMILALKNACYGGSQDRLAKQKEAREFIGYLEDDAADLLHTLYVLLGNDDPLVGLFSWLTDRIGQVTSIIDAETNDETPIDFDLDPTKY